MPAATLLSQREVIGSRWLVALFAPINFSKLIVFFLQPHLVATPADSRNQGGDPCQQSNNQLDDQVRINQIIDRFARLCGAAQRNNQLFDHYLIDQIAI
ncbi:hypothetical protein [Duganella fentianensis]|uniref:hypothetical protein n=1 Tax=Duganella fentianensis TaxID=2692177 RepID=UPI0032B1DA66